MTQQNEYDKAYAKRLERIDADPDYTILATMNQPNPDAGKTSQYIVYTDFKKDDKHQKTNSIFVYSPFANIDKYGHSKAEFQNQLLFETNYWKNQIHIVVLETLGAESRLAFYDFRNLGFAQLSLTALIRLATRNELNVIDGYVSSFDRKNIEVVKHLFTKNEFQIEMTDPANGIATFERTLN